MTCQLDCRLLPTCPALSLRYFAKPGPPASSMLQPPTPCVSQPHLPCFVPQEVCTAILQKIREKQQSSSLASQAAATHTMCQSSICTILKFAGTYGQWEESRGTSHLSSRLIADPL